MYDIAIIGAGIVGTAIARELSRYYLRIVVLEKHNDVANGATKANSAIVHAGYDAHRASLKAKLNVEGNRLYPKICAELSVPFRRVGSLVCAFSKAELDHVAGLLENGRKLGVPGLELIDSATVFKMEPNVSKNVLGALWAPSAGITEPWELAIAYAENAMENGVELRLNFPVTAIRKRKEWFSVKSGGVEVLARTVINCAGVNSDTVCGMVSGDPGFSIKPRRGQYFLLDKSCGNLVKSVIFPAPSVLGKGTLVTPTVDGNVLIGPDAEDLGDDMRDSTDTTSEGLENVKAMAGRIVDNIPFGGTITTFSGLRAEPSTGDFIIGESDVRGFVNVAGIKSPGLSSAPAISVYVADIVKEMYPELRERIDFMPIRRARIRMEGLGEREKADIIRRDPRYGKIVCRCEMITEGEIVDAIHRKAGATTLNGVKRRVRPGAGRCQGGFCSPRILEILARELGQDMTQIRLEDRDSRILTG